MICFNFGLMGFVGFVGFVQEINTNWATNIQGLCHHRKYITPLRTAKERVSNSTGVRSRCWALLAKHCATNHDVWPRAIVFENSSALLRSSISSTVTVGNSIFPAASNSENLSWDNTPLAIFPSYSMNPPITMKWPWVFVHPLSNLRVLWFSNLWIKLNVWDLIVHLCTAFPSDERLSTVEVPNWLSFLDQLQPRTWVPDDAGRFSSEIHWGQEYWDGWKPMNKQKSCRGSSKGYPIRIADQRDIRNLNLVCSVKW